MTLHCTRVRFYLLNLFRDSSLELLHQDEFNDVNYLFRFYIDGNCYF
jgi:hypothetical protein